MIRIEKVRGYLLEGSSIQIIQSLMQGLCHTTVVLIQVHLDWSILRNGNIPFHNIPAIYACHMPVAIDKRISTSPQSRLPHHRQNNRQHTTTQ